MNTFPPCTAESCSVDEEEKSRHMEEQAHAEATKQKRGRQAHASRDLSDSENPRSCAMTEKCVSACAAYGKVCPCAARIAAQTACRTVQKLREDSKIFEPLDPEGAFVFLDADDVVIGERLGEGGFCYVNQCVITAGKEAGQEFAIKYLKRKTMVDLHSFKHGAADLAVEAHFLSAMQHPNIVRLHGVTAGSVETNVASGKECGFFIVIDRLIDTLEERIEQYAASKDNHANIIVRRTHEYKERRRKEFMQKIRVAYMIADAMEYLHSRGVVFRDLKPDNIGFDKNGVLKLFDFGLARELKSKNRIEGDRYKLTGNTGSRRYMAPEVALDEPYNQSVDVYSFGILLWELCAADKPFYGFSSGKHMQLVVLGGERPSMDHHHTHAWPMNLQWLIKRCWATAPEARPSFTTIKSVLRDILADKEEIPESSPEILAEETPTEKDSEPSVESGSTGGLGSFLRSPLRGRGKAKVNPPIGGFQDLKPGVAPNGRSKTFGGFGLRR